MPDPVNDAKAARQQEGKPAAPDKPQDPNEALIEDLTKQAHDLDAVRKSVEDAAAVSGALWFSYLFTLLYIAIAAGAVTHKDLLLENSVKLPFLGVELPLVAFFALAPILFVISHAYTLMHFVILAAKVGVYDTELREKLPGKEAAATRLGLRRQLPTNIFVQFLGGPSDIRGGGLGWLLKAVAWISLVIGPVLLLLLIQIQFLPYHLEWVTWVQRFALLADLILLWLLWPTILNSRSKILLPRPWRSTALASLALLSLLPVGLAFTVATFPGEWIDEHVGKKQWIPLNRAAIGLDRKDAKASDKETAEEPKFTSFHDVLFNGDVNLVTRRRDSLFSNTLVLPGFDAFEAGKKLDNGSIKNSIILRGRHLEGAVLSGADLRKADLEGAQLQGADVFEAQLQGASLDNAHLQGASLEAAQLQGASLDNAQLQRAWLHDAQLQGASLEYAQLQGARLPDAQLQGASLDHAELQGAWLQDAQFQGALLDDAQLQGASLYHAQLQGASLVVAQLQGASLDHAQLQGASLRGAQLQGADFTEGALVATNLTRAEIWRSNFVGAYLKNVDEDGLSEQPVSKEDFIALKDDITESIPDTKPMSEYDSRESVLKRIEILNPDNTSIKDFGYSVLDAAKVDKPAYQQALAAELETLACSHDNDSVAYLVGGFVRNARIADTGTFEPQLATDILACPVAAKLADEYKAILKKIAKDVAAKAPAQTGKAAPSAARDKR